MREQDQNEDESKTVVRRREKDERNYEEVEVGETGRVGEGVAEGTNPVRDATRKRTRRSQLRTVLRGGKRLMRR